MPRQKKDVWYSFKEIIVGGVKRAKCKTCGFEVVNNAARMEKHMRDCRNVDDDDDIQEQSTSSATTTSSAPPAPKKRQTALNVISTNPTRQHESDILVTRYFIATNTPFNAASNKELVDYASTLANAISSSAGLERCFSTLGLTYGKLRSSLGVEKAGKLAFLFKQLNE